MNLIRIRQVADKCGWSVSHTWRQSVSDPQFPKPVKLSAGITGFIESEVDTYLEAKVAAARAVQVQKPSVSAAAKKSAEVRKARKAVAHE